MFQVQEWVDKLSEMSASDELSESQVRQLLFDLETAYGAFNKFLHKDWVRSCEVGKMLTKC